MLKIFSLITIFLCIPFLLLAEQPGNDEPVFSLEEVVVTATRTEMRVLDAPVHISIITSEEINRSVAKNLADLLSDQVGLVIRDYGAIGELKSVSIRGSSSEGVLILLDGVRLNDSRQGSLDLSLIPLENIERIEMVRGGTSALYGSDAVGGVINIITKKKADGIIRVKLENGSYIPRDAVKVYEGGDIKDAPRDYLDLVDTQILNIEYSRMIDKASLVTTGSFTRANNSFVWNDSEYTGEYRKRINASAVEGKLYTGLFLPLSEGSLDVSGIFSYAKKGGLFLPLSEGSLDVSGIFSYAKKGTPGSISSPSTDAKQEDIFASGYFNYKNPGFLIDFLNLDIKGFYKFYQLDYENPDELYPVDDRHKTHTFGIDILQEMIKYDFLDLVNSTTIGEKNRISGGIFLESTLYPSLRLTVIPALRYDLFSDFPNSFNFKLGSNYKVTNRVALKGSVSKSYRAPTLNDLYWPSDPWTEGNPDLLPETSYSADAGISAILDNARFDAFVFTRYTKDEIKWNMGDDYIFRPYNIQETLYPGFETGGELNFLNNLWFKAGYTFIYSFVLESTSGNYDLKDGLRVPYVPVHSIDAGIEYHGKSNILGLKGEYTGKRFIDEANSNSVDPYLVLNLNFKHIFTPSLAMTLSIDNLLNKTYQSLDGYIMPPMFIRTGLEAMF